MAAPVSPAGEESRPVSVTSNISHHVWSEEMFLFTENLMRVRKLA